MNVNWKQEDTLYCLARKFFDEHPEKHQQYIDGSASGLEDFERWANERRP